MEGLDDWLKELKDVDLAAVIKRASDLAPIIRRGVPERLESIRINSVDFRAALKTMGAAGFDLT